MKQYRYFVAYGTDRHSDDAIKLGIGDYVVESVLDNTVISAQKPILSEEDVRNVEGIIGEKLAGGMRTYVNVKIISFQLLGEFEEGGV